MKKIRGILFFIALMFTIGIGIHFVYKKQNKTQIPAQNVDLLVNELTNQVGELTTQITALQIENGRLEIIIERIKEVDSTIVIEASNNLE